MSGCGCVNQNLCDPPRRYAAAPDRPSRASSEPLGSDGMLDGSRPSGKTAATPTTEGATRFAEGLDRLMFPAIAAYLAGARDAADCAARQRFLGVTGVKNV